MRRLAATIAPWLRKGRAAAMRSPNTGLPQQRTNASEASVGESALMSMSLISSRVPTSHGNVLKGPVGRTQMTLMSDIQDARYSGFQAGVNTPEGKIFRFVRPVAPGNF